MVLISGVIAQNIHIEPGALLDHGQPDAPSSDDRNRFPRHFVAQKRQVGMPVVPFVFTQKMLCRPHLPGQRAQHEEGKLCRSFSEHVGGMDERNLIAVGVGAIDVVKADSNLRHHSEFSLARLEYFSVDGVTQGGNQAVDP